jgi:hypothetical protein
MKIKYEAANSELQRVVDTGLLLLPESATSELTTVMAPRYVDWQELPFEEFWESEESRLKNSLSRLIAIARADLKK